MEMTAIYNDNGKIVTMRPEALIYTRGGIVTCNSQMREQLAAMDSVAATELRVMIVGEQGTFKDHYAEYIHRKSGRNPYIRFDCAATRIAQYEQTLFGPRGIVASAAGGTVLMDGVSEIPYPFYERLIEFLEQPGDVRILATSSVDLLAVAEKAPSAAKLFRQLGAVQLQILPLRQRQEDIALLAMHYLERANRKYGTDKRMGSRLFQAILAYPWPGNERELERFLDRIVLVCGGEVLADPELLERMTEINETDLAPQRPEPQLQEGRSLKDMVAEYELMLIHQSIRKYGSLRKAAKALQIAPSALSRKLAAEKEGPEV